MLSRNLITLHRTLNSLTKSSKCVTVHMRRSSGWTQDKIVKSPYKSIEVPNCTLYDYVWQNLEKWPERTVAVCSTTGRGYTYEQAFKLSNTFAANLRKKFKIRDGDTVSIMLPNIPEFPLVAMGILEAGGVVSTINPVYTAHVVQHQLQLSNSKLVVTLPETVKVVKDSLRMAKLDIQVIVVRTNENPVPEGTILFNELSEDLHTDTSCLKEVRRTVNDICFLPHSSGTTALPKGVELSNGNVIANCEQINEPLISAHNETTATHQDSVMTVLPFVHIYGASVIMFHKMSQGIKLVTLDKFQPQNFLNAMEKFKTNILFATPPILLMMAAQGSPKSLQYLDIIINGAAPLASSDADKLIAKAEKVLDFRQGYGMTETSPVVTNTPRGLLNYGCVGRPVPNTELKIVDNDLKTLGPNEKGELLIKGPQVMTRGYRNNAKSNAEAFTVDGWFRTGDLAVIDDDGILTIADRLNELIKVKGYQVPPAELEGVLRDHPAISDAAVVGIPHPTNGEAPKAFIVLKKDQKVHAKEISDFVNDKVAPYKKINDIVFVDSIPKSGAGKILRRELKEKYC